MRGHRVLLSEHYRRYQTAPPESTKGKMTRAWLQHSERFTPELRKYQTAVYKVLEELGNKIHIVRNKEIKAIAPQMQDYIKFSMDSFHTYLIEYCVLYFCDIAEDKSHDLSEMQIQKLKALLNDSIEVHLLDKKALMWKKGLKK